MLRALPYILIGLAFYGGWYYWQQRPKEALAADLLRLEVTDVKQVFVQPANSPAFQFGRVEEGWLISSGHNHRLEVSQRPETLLAALINMRSIDLAPTPEAEDQLAALELRLQDDSPVKFELYRAPDSVAYQTVVRFGEQPDYFALDNFDHQHLPLAFTNYRSYELLKLDQWATLDSLQWQRADTTLTYWSRPDSSQQLDSLKQLWGHLTGTIFADYFDEIGDEPDWYGSYRLFGGSDSADLKVYFDTLWPRPFVLYSTQYPKTYFAVDSLPLPLLGISR